jgi:hypothetical protein
MAADGKLWRKNMCGFLRTLADARCQRENWFGKGKYVSSPEEMYNELFSDFDIEQFLTSPQVALTDDQRSAGKDLVAKLEAFDKAVGPDLIPEKVIDHPEWAKIRTAAQAFHKALGCVD